MIAFSGFVGFVWKSVSAFEISIGFRLKYGGPPFVLLLDSSTFRSPSGETEIDLRSNHTKKQIEMKKRRSSFPPPGDS